MKTFSYPLVLSALLFVNVAAGEAQSPDDCYEDAKKAKEDCGGAVLKAGELNSALSTRMIASINQGTGTKQTGGDQSVASQTGTDNGNWAIGECKRSRKEVNEKCSDAARRTNEKIKNYREQNREDLAKKEEANLEQIKKNYKDSTSYIDDGVKGTEADIASLQTAGVQGGNNVSSSVDRNSP